MGYEALPRVTLANLPTPLEEAENLRKVIGGPRLFIKRDDLNGLGSGGNKLRKLEFLMGEALRQGADTVVTSGAMQTNHGRLTAAAAARLGLDCILVMTEKDCGYYEGNRILQELFGACQVFAQVDYGVPPENLDKEKLRAGDVKIAEVIRGLKAAGKKPYLIPRGGRSLQGTAAYCAAMAELKGQLDRLGVEPDHILVPVATGSTLTGVTLGAKICGLKALIHGVALSRSPEEGRQMVSEEFNKDAAAMGYSCRIGPEDVIIYGDYIGEGYGIMTRAGQKAIRLLAETEGILLDPVYTSKAMSAYLDFVSRGFFKENETVVFFHTGGLPLLFLREVSDWLGETAGIKEKRENDKNTAD